MPTSDEAAPPLAPRAARLQEHLLETPLAAPSGGGGGGGGGDREEDAASLHLLSAQLQAIIDTVPSRGATVDDHGAAAAAAVALVAPLAAWLDGGLAVLLASPPDAAGSTVGSAFICLARWLRAHARLAPLLAQLPGVELPPPPRLYDALDASVRRLGAGAPSATLLPTEAPALDLIAAVCEHAATTTPPLPAARRTQLAALLLRRLQPLAAGPLLGMSGRPRPDLETPHPLTMLKQLLASGGTPAYRWALGGVLAEVERPSAAPRRHAALLAAALLGGASSPLQLPLLDESRGRLLDVLCAAVHAATDGGGGDGATATTTTTRRCASRCRH